MSARRFYQVNVFSNDSYYGNPVAVVLDSNNITTKQMQEFANWTNLSETTFILPSNNNIADYYLRIFTPSRELPFAGHPTLGSCEAWLKSGNIPKNSNYIIQECQKGLIKIRINKENNEIRSFEAPELYKDGPLDENEVEIIANGLGIHRNKIISHSWCDNGPRWRAVLLDSSINILSLKPNPLILGNIDLGVIGPRCKIGVITPSSSSTTLTSSTLTTNNQLIDKDNENNNENNNEENDYDFEVRAFCPLDQPFEDPVTGSLNAGIAQWFFSSGIVTNDSYCVRQGTALGRKGRIYVTRQVDEYDKDENKGNDEGNQKKKIWIGGKSTVCIEGIVYI